MYGNDLGGTDISWGRDKMPSIFGTDQSRLATTQAKITLTAVYTLTNESNDSDRHFQLVVKQGREQGS